MNPNETAFRAGKTNVDIAQTIAGGKMPTNAQLEAVLSSTAQVLQREGSTLPPAGHKAAQDATTVVADLQQFLREKNEGETIQGIISDFAAMKTTTGSALRSNAIQGQGEKAKRQTLSGTQLRQQISPGMRDLMNHTKSLTKSIVRSSQLRAGFKELFETLRWGYFERSQATTDYIQNNWAPIPQSTFATSTGVPSTSSTSTAAPTTSFPVQQGELQREAGGIQQNLPATYTTGAGTTVIPGETPLPQPSITPLTNEKDPKKLELLRKIQSIRPMTEAQRTEFRNRLINVLTKFSQNEEFKNALLNIYSMFMFYKDRGTTQLTETKNKIIHAQPPAPAPTTTSAASSQAAATIAKKDMEVKVAGTTSGVPFGPTLTPEEQFREVTRKLKKFVQSFVPGKSINNFIFYTNEFFKLVYNNAAINTYFNDVGDFLKQFMNSNYQSIETVDQSRVRQLDELLLRGDSLFLSFTNHYVIYRMMCEGIDILNAIKSDPLRKKLVDDTRIFVRDFIVYDAYGRASLNEEVVSQMRTLLLPLLKEQLYYIPIPRLEGTSEKLDFWVENLVFATGDILPENLRFDLNHSTMVDRTNMAIPASVTRIYLTLDNVKTNMKNVRFWYRKKTTPKITDEGFADVALGGRGIRIKLVILANFSSPQPFKTESVKVDCDKLRIKIHDSHHDFLYAVVLAFFKGRIKREMETKAEASVRSAFDKMNTQLNRLVMANPQTSQTTKQPGMLSRATQPVVQALGNFANPQPKTKKL